MIIKNILKYEYNSALSYKYDDVSNCGCGYISNNEESDVSDKCIIKHTTYNTITHIHPVSNHNNNIIISINNADIDGKIYCFIIKMISKLTILR